MSYDISLCDPVTHETLRLNRKHGFAGGTYMVGGTDELWLNVTYNYGNIFRRPDVLGDDGIRSIYGLTGADSIPLLQNAINHLGNDLDDDYWKPTEGNARMALVQLLMMAEFRPDGVWKGD